MPIALLIPLITALAPLGVQAFTLISGLITKWQTGGAVTPEEWSSLSGSLKLTAADHAAAAVKAAGLDPADPKVAAFLTLTK